MFLVPPGARRRLVVRVVQADRQPCVLESCKQVRLHRLQSTLPLAVTRSARRARAGSGSSTGPTSVEARILAVDHDSERRVLKLLTDWPQSGDDAEPLATIRGERLSTTVDLQLYMQGVNSVVPVRRAVALKLEETGAMASFKRTLAAKVRRRFEEGGANRAHLLGSSLEVNVSRGIAAPGRVLEGMVKAVTRADGPSPAGGAGVVPGMRLNAPPPPRVRRPKPSTRVKRPYADSDGAAASVPPTTAAAGSSRVVTPPLPPRPDESGAGAGAGAGTGAGAGAGASAGAGPGVPLPPSFSPAPLEDVAVSDAPPGKSGFLVVNVAGHESRRWVALEPPFLALYKVRNCRCRCR